VLTSSESLEMPMEKQDTYAETEDATNQITIWLNIPE